MLPTVHLHREREEYLLFPDLHMYLAFRIGPLLGSFLETVSGKLHHFQSKFCNRKFPAISTVKPLHLNATEG